MTLFAPMTARSALEGALLDYLPSAVISLDGRGEVTFVNPAAEQLLQLSANQLLGRLLDSALAPHSPLMASVGQARHERTSVSEYGIELALLRGQTTPVDAHIVMLPEPQDHSLIVLQRCSVAQKLDQQQAPRGNRSIAGLARTLAHEVKNPLSGIRGAAQLLDPYVGDDDKPLIRLICDEADRICDLVDRMDVFSDQAPLDRSPVNIHQVLEHVRRIAENGFARHLRLVERYDPSLPDVAGDRDQLVQAFLNLIKNAAEAAPRNGGTITISTRYQHGLRIGVGSSRERVELPIMVDVADNGSGVAEELEPHLFEPFISTKPKGSGLGLPLVAKLIDDHGGMVAYVPGDPGAIFRVRLPAVSARRQ